MDLNHRLHIKTLLPWLGILILASGVFLASPVKADEGTLTPDSGCLTCHEDLYYLNDTGKWLCLCGTQMTCTCCHGGNPQALTEEDAHLDMVIYPTRNDARPCQNCHPGDSDARVERFSEVAGISPMHSLPPTPTGVFASADVSNNNSPFPHLQSRFLDPWRLAGLIFIALILVAIMILGYRCWKADCLARKLS